MVKFRKSDWPISVLDCSVVQQHATKRARMAWMHKPCLSHTVTQCNKMTFTDFKTSFPPAEGCLFWQVFIFSSFFWLMTISAVKYIWSLMYTLFSCYNSITVMLTILAMFDFKLSVIAHQNLFMMCPCPWKFVLSKMLQTVFPDRSHGPVECILCFKDYGLRSYKIAV